MSQHLDGLKAALADRYAIERELGEGGMATVYLARDLRHKRPVAIKVLKPELSANLGVERFLAEIEITANLNHPHILPLHDSGRVDGSPYYVMPYVEGESLRDRLEATGPIEVREAVRIAREVADALAHAHERGVIHRDIKPDNLLLVSGHAVIADFGIARAVTAAGIESRGGTGAIVGSPAYMSPEQANDRELDGRADLYALGCVLYEMLTGEPPFVGKGLSLLASHLGEPPPSVSATRPEVPRDLDAAIQQALAKAPEDRHETAARFGEALRASLRAEALRRHGTLPATLVTYGAGGWLLSRLLTWVTREYVLPDWVQMAGLGLLGLGLPVFAATAYLNRTRHNRGTGAGRFFSWRNALAGGVVACGTLGLGAAGYATSRALGVGPGASLISRGALEERDPLILAEFSGSDSVHARTATEALRTDLLTSDVVTLVSAGAISDALGRMRRDPNDPLLPEVAREIAVRDGLKGVIQGSINPAGEGFVISVELVSSEDGTTLVSDRETARDPDDFIRALDKLSRRLRSRLGESLGSIRASPGLPRLTTSSLDALERHTAGFRAELAGDRRRALALYDEAVRIDTAFAAAHAKIAIMSPRDGERQFRALTKARDLAGTLPEAVQVRFDNLYHGIVTGDLEQAIVAGERGAEIAPEAFGNNLAISYWSLGSLARAEELFRPIADRGLRGPTFQLALVLGELGRFDEAGATLDRFAELSPQDPGLYDTRAKLAVAHREYEFAARQYRALQDGSPGGNLGAHRGLGHLHAIGGRLDEARSEYRQARSIQERRGDIRGFLIEVARLGEIEAVVEGDPDGALGRIADALRRHPLDSLPPRDRPYRALASMYAEAGRPDEARTLLAAYQAEIQPKHFGREVERLRASAQAALAEGDPTSALADLEELETIPNVECRPLCTVPVLARAYEELGRPDSAVVAYERYLSNTGWRRIEYDPLYLALIYERLGSLYDERDDPERAMSYYSELVELWADADEALQPRVRAARRRLEEIRALQG